MDRPYLRENHGSQSGVRTDEALIRLWHGRVPTLDVTYWRWRSS